MEVGERERGIGVGIPLRVKPRGHCGLFQGSDESQLPQNTPVKSKYFLCVRHLLH